MKQPTTDQVKRLNDLFAAGCAFAKSNQLVLMEIRGLLTELDLNAVDAWDSLSGEDLVNAVLPAAQTVEDRMLVFNAIRNRDEEALRHFARVNGLVANPHVG